MKKKSKQTTTETAAAVIAEQIIQNALPKPSVKAIMYRISSLTAACKRQHDTDPEQRAKFFAQALSEIDTAASNYWKHHARA